MKRSSFSKTIFILFSLAMILALVGACMIGDGSGGDVFNSRLNPEYEAVTDYQTEELEDPDAPAGVVKEYRWTLELGEGHPETLAFYSAHHYIEVSLDGETVYALSPATASYFAKTSGNGWVILPLTEGDLGKEVCVRVTPVYTSVKNRTFDFFIGAEFSILFGQLRWDLPQLLLGQVVFCAGFIFTCASLFNSLKRRKQDGLFYLGTFSMIIGIWKITDTRFIPLLFSKHILLLTYLPLAMLLLAPLPLLQFIKSILDTRKNSLLDGVSMVSGLSAVVLLLLQLSGMMDLRMTLPVCHGVIILSAVAATFELIRFWMKNKRHQKAAFTMACLLACTLGSCLDLLLYYVRGNSTSILYTLTIFLFYAIVMGAMTMRDMNTLANVDQHTGLFNRNRCNEVLDAELTADQKISAFMFDVNDLKHVNDTMGHVQGDRLLNQFAEILRNELPKDAFVGRYGGDEFIAVVNETSEEALQSIVKRIRAAVESYNRDAAEEGLPPLSSACGYATSAQVDFSSDTMTLNDLLRMADEAMYEDKKIYHERKNLDMR